MTLLKPKFLVSYLKPCPFRTKIYSFGFYGLGKGLPERNWKPQWSIPRQSTAGLGRSLCGQLRVPIIVKIATRPHIIQSLKHSLSSSSNFLLLSNGSSNPVSSTELFFTEGVATPFALFDINAQFPWFPYHAIERPCSLIGTQCKSFYAAFVPYWLL